MIWLLIILYFYVVCFISIVETANLETNGSDYSLYSPKTLKNKTNMNWFGSIVCFSLWSLISPLIFVGKVVYWLFHV